MYDQVMSLSFGSEDTTETGQSNVSVNMTITGEDLEYLPNVMNKVESFLRAIGFDYVRLEAPQGDYGNWTYFQEAGDSPVH